MASVPVPAYNLGGFKVAYSLAISDRRASAALQQSLIAIFSLIESMLFKKAFCRFGRAR
jgi:hypothetical protein